MGRFLENIINIAGIMKKIVKKFYDKMYQIIHKRTGTL